MQHEHVTRTTHKFTSALSECYLSLFSVPFYNIWFLVLFLSISLTFQETNLVNSKNIISFYTFTLRFNQFHWQSFYNIVCRTTWTEWNFFFSFYKFILNRNTLMHWFLSLKNHCYCREADHIDNIIHMKIF